ncbi:hypothetical protein HYC85_029772 [Camellia sinensis]|uniref:Uncharacterized protein n=1 Tax=Camellia sinensis TaxID=4442 RepID=A0A7J7G065_CAMSI|nr:hypothetical protein HYC85_029772 [Camellia sinensis]
MFNHINSSGDKKEDHRPPGKSFGLMTWPSASRSDQSAKSGGRLALYLAGRP